MHGFKERLSQSVALRLSFAISLAILVVAVVGGVFSFASAFDEANELQDDTLHQVAGLFDRHQFPPKDDTRRHVSHEESGVIVQHLADGQAWTGSAGISLPIPVTISDGLHTLDAGGGEQFRVLVRTRAVGDRIAVAQESGIRDEIARDSALRTLMPFLILIPILLLIVANLVRKMFRPIASLSAEIDQREERELHPVKEGRLPIEVRPFAVAINRLLARVAQSMEGQRRFVADAAHELRSPLTAMSLQAERLAAASMSALAHEQLAALRDGIERGRNLLEQLLTLAKAQVTSERPQSLVSVQGVYRRALEDLMPLAEVKHIDIGIEGAQDARVLVSESDLVVMVRNLVDNAIRYTPNHGRVDLSVSVDDGCTTLQVRDTGPGIPPSERSRVFDPFYRILGSEQIGSGLGLSIVKTIADRLGADVQLAYSDEAKQSGLCVSVRLPMVQPSEGE